MARDLIEPRAGASPVGSAPGGNFMLHTIGALTLAPIIYAVTALAMALLAPIVMFMDRRYSIGCFAIQICGPTYAVGWACGRWTPHYARRVIFAEVVLLIVASAILFYLYDPLQPTTSLEVKFTIGMLALGAGIAIIIAWRAFTIDLASPTTEEK